MTRATCPRLLQGCLAVAIVLPTLAWSLAFVSFNDLKMVGIWLGAVALAPLVVVCYGGGTCAAFRAWGPAWVGLIILGTLGVVGAQVPWLSVNECLRSGGLVIFATLAYPLLRTEVGCRVAFQALVVSATLAAWLGLGQRVGMLDAVFPRFDHYDQRMYSVFGNEGLLGGYMALGLILLPEVVWKSGVASVWRRWGILIFLGLPMLLVLWFSASRGAQVAFLLGGLFLCGGGGCRMNGYRGGVLGAGVVGFLLILFQLGGSVEKWRGTFSESDVGGQTRLWIWDASFALLRDHPLGVGLGNYSYWIPQYMGASSFAFENRAVTYHSHFDLLELLCETGVIGFVLVIWLLTRVTLRNRTAGAGFVTLAIFSMIHPVWSSPAHGLAALLLLGVNLRSPAVDHSCAGGAGMWRGVVLGGVVALVGLIYGMVAISPSFLLRRAEDLHLAGKDAAGAYESAVSGFGFRGEAHLNYSVYLYQQGAFQRAYRQLEEGAKEMDTGRLHYMRYQTAVALGLGEAEASAWLAAQSRWPWLTAPEAKGEPAPAGSD